MSSKIKYFTDRSKAVDLLWIFFLCLLFAMPLYAFVYLCLVVTCWETADLLALVWFVVSGSLSLSLSHDWYPGSDVLLDCIDS